MNIMSMNIIIIINLILTGRKLCVRVHVVTLHLFLMTVFQTVKTYKTETLKVSKSIAQRKVSCQKRGDDMS